LIGNLATTMVKAMEGSYMSGISAIGACGAFPGLRFPSPVERAIPPILLGVQRDIGHRHGFRLGQQVQVAPGVYWQSHYFGEKTGTVVGFTDERIVVRFEGNVEDMITREAPFRREQLQ
jgi:hypothetical protein